MATATIYLAAMSRHGGLQLEKLSARFPGSRCDVQEGRIWMGEEPNEGYLSIVELNEAPTDVDPSDLVVFSQSNCDVFYWCEYNDEKPLKNLLQFIRENNPNVIIVSDRFAGIASNFTEEFFWDGV